MGACSCNGSADRVYERVASAAVPFRGPHIGVELALGANTRTSVRAKGSQFHHEAAKNTKVHKDPVKADSTPR
jgi:hypothetical protein